MNVVYMIENNITNEAYIGETFNYERRKQEHKDELNSNSHHSYKLQNAWNEHNEDNFIFKILEELDDVGSPYKNKMQLIYLEGKYINQYDSINKGYNIENTIEEILSGRKVIMSKKLDVKYLTYLINHNEFSQELNLDSKNIKIIKEEEIINYFSKLPNKLFYSVNPEEDSILVDNNYNYKTLLILDYLYMNTNRRGVISFCVQDMVIACGFRCKNKKGEPYDQFKIILSKLKENNIIKSDVDFLKCKPSGNISCTLELNLDNQFFKLYDDEKDKILNQTICSANNLKILIYYCYLKCRMYKHNDETKENIDKHHIEICFPSFKTINDDLGITDSSIYKYNSILVDLNLIRIDSAGLWSYKDDPAHEVKESCNIYTLFTDEKTAKNNLDKGIKYYKSLDINSNKIFTGNKEYRNNDHRLNGELGSIIKKEKLGTATEKDINRKQDILKMVGRR